MSTTSTRISLIQNALERASGNKAQAARLLGVPVTTLKSQIARLGLGQEGGEVEALDTVIQRLFELSNHQVKVPNWVTSGRAATRSAGTPTLHVSDWHFGEVVEANQVMNYNRFNPSIARARWQTLFTKTAELCFDHKVMHDYPGVVLNLGGDFVSGNIHQELTNTNEGTSLEHVLEMSDMLVWGIDQLIEMGFPSVFVSTCVGNHGRTTRRPPYKDVSASNFDWLIYCIAARHFKHNEHVTFQLANGFDSYYVVNGVRYVNTHGDRLGVKGGDGIVGITGPLIRGVTKLQHAFAQMGKPVDQVIIAHWHTVLRLKHGIVNGSGKGYDEFSMGHRFEPELPAQLLWFTHPKYGITTEHTLFLEEPILHKEQILMEVA